MTAFALSCSAITAFEEREEMYEDSQGGDYIASWTDS